MPPQRLTLRPGQQQAWYLPAGSTVQVCAGRVGLHAPPQWLADQVLQPHLILACGGGHRLAQGGWVRLQALGGPPAVVQVLPAPPGAPARLAAALRQWLQRRARCSAAVDAA